MSYDDDINDWYDRQVPFNLKRVSLLEKNSGIPTSTANAVMAYCLTEPTPTKKCFIKDAEKAFSHFGFYVPQSELSTIYDLVRDQI